MSEASLRINESLDLDKVLQQVVDSARGLTGSRYATMAVFDEIGELESFVTSGFDAEEQERFMNLPGGRDLFRNLRHLSQPLRVRNFQDYVRLLGFPGMQFPMRLSDSTCFLAAPILYQGESIGNVYLAEKEGAGEYSQEDEETVVMFSSQAALVIANSRRYRDEQNARTGLETLIDTSPVGVIVFDARTGQPESSNQEAARIIESLREPHSPPEQIIEGMIIRRADGREISLEEGVAQVVSAGERVRAEEIKITVPDGRSVNTLVNATPMRSEDGQLESVIVTLQDMSAVEELERMRTEFLAMVSHELRTPLTSIKGSAATLLEGASSLHPAEMRQFFSIIAEQAERMRGLISDLLDVTQIETGTLPVAPRPVDLTELVKEAVTTFMTGGEDYDVQIHLAPGLPLIMADRLRIAQVIANLLSNAARHSEQRSPIRISAVREAFHVAVSITDEGQGVTAERLPFLFRKFFRIDESDRASHTGLGLAICKGIVEAHGGRIWGESEGPGLGSRFTFTIPVVEDAGAGGRVEPTHLSAPLHQAENSPSPILVVDDDPQALRYIRNALTKAGYAPVVTADPREVSGLMKATHPHLVLLDLILPGTDGIKVMQDILKDYDVPVIFLSAYGQEHSVARAFDMGAADYVVKPFAPTELAARIRAALRKRSGGQFGLSEPYRRGDLRIDYAEREVYVADRPVEMTAIEYRLLYELSINAGRVLTHEYLFSRVWGQDHPGDSQPIRSFIKKLRRKLGDDAKNPRYIFTKPRVGYRMAKADNARVTDNGRVFESLQDTAT